MTQGAVSRSPLPRFQFQIAPCMFGLCEPITDVVLGAGVFEGMRPNELSSLRRGLDVRRNRVRPAWRGEVGSVVGKDGMDLVRDSGDLAAQESAAVLRATFSCQLDVRGTSFD